MLLFLIGQILTMQVTVIQLWMRRMDQVQDQRELTDGRELEILGLPRPPAGRALSAGRLDSWTTSALQKIQSVSYQN